jgi:lysophospholipase L1-like esterase
MKTYAFRSILAVATVMAAACGPGGRSPVDVGGDALSVRSPAYLALGDSIAFGDDPTLYPPAPRTPHWFVGYPTFLSEAIDVPVLNAACPGETSGSFLSPEAPDNGCREWRSGYGIHVEYTGTQREFAVAFLRDHARTRLVTIATGVNDLILLQQACAGDASCIVSGLPGVLGSVGTNFADTLASVRGEAGYEGQIVVPTYYSPRPDPLYVTALTYLNATLRSVAVQFGADVADVQGAFAEASSPHGGDPCAAGLLIPLVDEPGCDQHPSQAGQRLIAATIAKLVPARDSATVQVD